MKKLINDPKRIVAEMLEGAVALAPGQVLLSGETVVLRHPLGDPGTRRVAVLSGGGSGTAALGDEPLHPEQPGQVGVVVAPVPAGRVPAGGQPVAPTPAAQRLRGDAQPGRRRTDRQHRGRPSGHLGLGHDAIMGTPSPPAPPRRRHDRTARHVRGVTDTDVRT